MAFSFGMFLLIIIIKRIILIALLQNVENSISITQNYTSAHNLEAVKKAITEYKKENDEQSKE